MSEKMSPNKTPKSPQKGSKRLKTTPFKVTLLDSAEFEGEIEVCVMTSNLWVTCFLELALTCFEQTVEKQCFLFPLLLFSSVGSCVRCTVLHRADKTGKENKREGATLSAHQGGEAKAMSHISVIHTVAQKIYAHKKVFIPHEICVVITPAV